IGKLGKINIDREFLFNSHILKIEPISDKVNRDYLYHFLISKSKEIENLKLGVILPALDIDRLKKIKISLPDLATQSRIANKLNKFWELSKELEKELNLRKKQYEYYRDELLSFKQDNKIEWLTLGEIATELYRGVGIKKDEAIEGVGHPCVRYGWIHTSNLIYFDKCPFGIDETLIKNKRYAEKNDLLFVITSENIQDIEKSCAYIGKKPILVGGDIVIMKHNQNPKYLAYTLSTGDALLQKTKGKIKSKVVHSNIDQIKKLIIPIPSLEKQQEIVNLLDKFWELSNNIKEGLPAEIFLRKQQYEYYRNKLLI
ncbi:hypothetical protein A6V39_05685, partial [Candidatus Mycoplasma haematobovis]